ncbi:MAG: peroxide stress protein YaaA [Bacteroidales bacterium]|nr:peroxide stress protein YaaA [Bacteroidales bacterium]
MLIILSPAKIQNFRPQRVIEDYTLPSFMKEAEELIKELLPFSIKELEKVLKVNPAIASWASDSYYNWKTSHNTGNSKQAILVYNGEVYRGLDASSLSVEELEYAQKHLRMISGLYGVLRPLDLIQPYRLEMNTKLKNSKGENLYKFWENTIPATISKAVKESGDPEIILNLTSHEYAKAVQFKKSGLSVIDFDFLENRHDGYKPITIYMKKARGMMARYILRNRIAKIEDIKGFDAEGYSFNERLSDEKHFVFTR